MENYKDKYGVIYPFEFDIHDLDKNFIVKLNTIRDNEMIYAKGKWYVVITDALIDTNIINYFKQNSNDEFYVAATNKFRNCETGEDHNAKIEFTKLKLKNFRIKTSSDEMSSAKFLFEAFSEINMTTEDRINI